MMLLFISQTWRKQQCSSVRTCSDSRFHQKKASAMYPIQYSGECGTLVVVVTVSSITSSKTNRSIWEDGLSQDEWFLFGSQCMCHLRSSLLCVDILYVESCKMENDSSFHGSHDDFSTMLRGKGSALFGNGAFGDQKGIISDVHRNPSSMQYRHMPIRTIERATACDKNTSCWYCGGCWRRRTEGNFRFRFANAPMCQSRMACCCCLLKQEIVFGP